MCQSAPVPETKPRDATWEDWEERIWKRKAHVTEEGEVFIPPMALKNCLSEAASYKSMKIPGKGNQKYTKHFVAGILCVEPLLLGVPLEKVDKFHLYVPADGKRGGKGRVWKIFPRIMKWEAIAEVLVLDDIITEEIFELTLRDAGQFIGLGTFRPSNNGFYGRFDVLKVDWS